jgi:uncharacterized protein (DUF2141 family)
MKLIFRLILFFFLTFLNVFPQEKKGEIKVEVVGFDSDEGVVRVLIFNKNVENGFPTNFSIAYEQRIENIHNKKAEIIFKDLPFDDYAISVHHDKNNNGVLDKNWVGIPTEAIGASNNPKAFLGPPSFDDAKITLNTKKIYLKINVNYIF